MYCYKKEEITVLTSSA